MNTSEQNQLAHKLNRFHPKEKSFNCDKTEKNGK